MVVSQGKSIMVAFIAEAIDRKLLFTDEVGAVGEHGEWGLLLLRHIVSQYCK